ncbi:hypothetical protein C8R43DRAFT_942411 [Mycena crocata]|nr:hypothetical protein C8R43DRAFT_942411 [Mycena crocata]
MRRINGTFYEAGGAKQLWRFVVTVLASRLLIDLPPNFGTLSANMTVEELIGVIKRTMHGPETWKRGAKPHIIQEVTWHPDPLSISPPMAVRVLSGGQHLLVVTRDSIECYAAETKQRAFVEMRGLKRCASQLLDGGQLLRIAVECAEYLGVRILEIDLRSGNSTALAQLEIPYGIDKVVLCGDVVAITSVIAESGVPTSLVVFNWRLDTYAIFAQTPEVLELTLVPRRVIVCRANFRDASRAEVLVYLMDNLTWHPLDRDGRIIFSVPPQQPPHDYVAVAPHVNHIDCQFKRFQVFARPCPVHEGDYVLSACAVSEHSLSLGDLFRGAFPIAGGVPRCGDMFTFRLSATGVSFERSNMVVASHSNPTSTGYSLERGKIKNTVLDVDMSRRAVRYDLREAGVLSADYTVNTVHVRRMGRTRRGRNLWDNKLVVQLCVLRRWLKMVKLGT